MIVMTYRATFCKKKFFDFSVQKLYFLVHFRKNVQKCTKTYQNVHKMYTKCTKIYRATKIDRKNCEKIRYEKNFFFSDYLAAICLRYTKSCYVCGVQSNREFEGICVFRLYMSYICLSGWLAEIDDLQAVMTS